MGEVQCPKAEQNHNMTETQVTDTANNPLTDKADQAPAGHISMFIDVHSTEEQQYKKEDAVVTTITFEATKTDPKTIKTINTN